MHSIFMRYFPFLFDHERTSLNCSVRLRGRKPNEGPTGLYVGESEGAWNSIGKGICRSRRKEAKNHQ